ncbi:putative organ specific protein [Helianthus annuus]|uniref:Organ specific protein n=1 Tax=Helianthus annuus TaxID=4232 RepID=A0A9K3GUV7_HELAN|nr:putative organ specific protein [Helianthus annuus]
MEASLAFLFLLSFVMSATNIDARPHPQDYWHDSFVQKGSSVSPQPIEKSHCHTLSKALNHISPVPNDNNNDFEPRPNISVYDNDTDLKDLKGKKNVGEEFEPRPNISVYDTDTNLKGQRNVDEEFEPRPNISVYDNDTSLKGKVTLSKEFEPRPNISVYEG